MKRPHHIFDLTSYWVVGEMQSVKKEEEKKKKKKKKKSSTKDS